MITADEVSIIGKVNKTHGVGGEMSVRIYDDGAYECIDQDSCLIFCLDGIFVPFFVATARSHGSESLLVTLDGVDSQAEAQPFVGLDVYMRLDDIPEAADDGDYDEEDGFYASQLMGYRAFTAAGSAIGDIADYDDSTDNPLFILRRPDGCTCYIPVADEFIQEIDPSLRTVIFSLPDGLLDL